MINDIIKDEKLELANKDYFIFVDKIGVEEPHLAQEYKVLEAKWLNEDVEFLRKEYRHSFIVTHNSNISALEKELAEQRKLVSKSIYLDEIKVRYLRSRKTLQKIIKKIEEILSERGEKINDEFLKWGYDSFNDKNEFIINPSIIIDTINKINTLLERKERVLAFWVLMLSIRAFENVPEKRRYKQEYKRYVKNTSIENIDTELVSFILYSKEDGKSKKFLFDEYKKFQKDSEVVGKKVYDSFETVDYYYL